MIKKYKIKCLEIVVSVIELCCYRYDVWCVDDCDVGYLEWEFLE